MYLYADVDLHSTSIRNINYSTHVVILNTSFSAPLNGMERLVYTKGKKKQLQEKKNVYLNFVLGGYTQFFLILGGYVQFFIMGDGSVF